MDDEHYVYKGEVQLAGWSDTHTGGAKVTLWLPEAADLDRFRAMTVRKGNTAGQVLMVAMVEVDNGGQPVRQPAQHELSKLAAALCRNPDFWAFWRDEFDEPTPRSEAEMADRMRTFLGIESRAELDTDKDVAAIFHERVRVPWREWSEDEQA